MVTPACYASTEVGRRYSRGCPPYSLGGYQAERRYPLPSHHDSRTSSMTERDSDDASHPRKRIAVAVTFAITASGVSFFGIGGSFWGLVAGGLLLASETWRPR